MSTDPKFSQSLSAALTVNRSCYSSVSQTYVVSGPQRAQQAERWLGPLWAHVAPSQGALLEIGSADGVLTGEIIKRGYSVTAVEFSPPMAAATRLAAPAARVIEGEFLETELPEATFDIVLANAVVHLFPPPFDEAVLRKAARLISRSGVIFVSTTLEGRYSSGYESKLGQPEVQRYRTRYRERDMDDLIRRSGLRVELKYSDYDRLVENKTWGNWVVGRKDL